MKKIGFLILAFVFTSCSSMNIEKNNSIINSDTRKWEITVYGQGGPAVLLKFTCKSGKIIEIRQSKFIGYDEYEDYSYELEYDNSVIKSVTISNSDGDKIRLNPDSLVQDKSQKLPNYVTGVETDFINNISFPFGFFKVAKESYNFDNKKMEKNHQMIIASFGPLLGISADLKFIIFNVNQIQTSINGEEVFVNYKNSLQGTSQILEAYFGDAKLFFVAHKTDDESGNFIFSSTYPKAKDGYY